MQNAQSIKALLFDVFGTVVDWRGSITREMQGVGDAKGLQADWEQFAQDWRALYQPAMEKIRSGDRGYVRLDVLHRENLDQLLPSYQLDSLSEAEIVHLNEVWHRLQPWADVLPGMHRLHRAFTLASLSNGNIAIMVNIARYNGIPWDAVLGSEPTKGYKPQPHVYLDSIDMLGLQANQCLMVASHNYDLRVARSLGMHTAYINRPYEYGEAQVEDMSAEEDWDFICDSVTELAAQLNC